MFGGTAEQSESLTIRLVAKAGSVMEMQLNRPGETIKVWKGDDAIASFDIPVKDLPPGPIWVQVTGTEVDEKLHLRRTTITVLYLV
ncbi:hypothetical protein L3081_25465 [Colwellia sp. MSW7]|uniref:Uncharacterized protein n=1 Tax=Colwellia maritima TaxID=2912588 RepID=A0ABS9X7F0_9GAMM|nr:hypothetical protein [Colwellia maritima]MCI2286165.1 hypothetical protein [Colwellia maritima]